MLASVAQLDACQNGDQEVTGSSPAGSATFFDFRFDSEMFSAVILSLPLIQEEKLSVPGERLCTVAVIRKDGYSVFPQKFI